MKVLFEEKIKALAEKNGWSMLQARGYVEGQVSRRRGAPPSQFTQVGFDEYCRAFRAGYYGRKIQSWTSEDTHPQPYGWSLRKLTTG